MFEWFSNRENRKTLAILTGFIPNFFALYFIDEDLFNYLLSRPFILLDIFAIGLVIVALIKDVGKMLSKTLFATSVGSIVAIVFKLIATFLINEGYWQV